MALLSKAAEQQFGAGIWPDSGNDTAPMIIDSNNVCYQNGRIGPIPQSVPFYNGDKQIDVIWTQNIEGVDNIFFVTSQEIRQIAGNVLTSLSFLTNKRKPQFATFGNFTLVADGGKLLVRRGASANFERIETAPLADFVIVYSPFVIVFHDRTASWCHIDDVDTWTPAAENAARSLPIRDMDSDIVAVLKALNGVVVFSETKAWILNFLGFPNWFGVRKLDVVVGPFSQQSVCLVDAFICGVGPTGIWRTDGNAVQFFDRPQLRKDFYGKLGTTSEVLCLYDRSNERIMIVFDDKEGTRSSIVWDNRYLNWYPTSNAYTAVDEGQATTDTIFGDGRGRLLSQNQRTVGAGSTNNSDGLRFKSTIFITYCFGAQPFSGPFGRQINSSKDVKISHALLVIRLGQQFLPAPSGDEDIFFETRDMDFGTLDEKYVDVITFNVTRPGAGIFYFSYCMKDRMEDEEVWSKEFAQSPDNPFFLRETARYFRYKIRNSSATRDWQLTAINTFGEVVGGRM